MGCNFRKFDCGTTGDHPLLGARIDKEQIFCRLSKNRKFLATEVCELLITHHSRNRKSLY